MVEIYNMIAEVKAVQRKQHNVDKMFKDRRMRVSILKFRSGIHFSFFLRSLSSCRNSALVCVMAEITWFRQLLDSLKISSLEMWNVGSEMETLSKTQWTWELRSFAKAIAKLIAVMKLSQSSLQSICQWASQSVTRQGETANCRLWYLYLYLFDRYQRRQ